MPQQVKGVSSEIWIVAGLCGILVLLDLLNGMARGSFLSLLPDALICVGVGLATKNRARLAAAAGAIGLALSWPLAPNLIVGPLFGAPLLALLLALRTQPYAAVIVTLAGLATSWRASRRARTVTDWLTALVAWGTIYFVAWVAALAVHRVQEHSQRDLSRRMDEQRRLIAAELHDNVAHELSLIVMRAEAARSGGASPDAELDYIADAGRRANRYLRNVMPLLHMAPIRPLALSEELRRSQTALREAGMTVTLLVDGDPESVPTAPADTLARVTREATNNMVRHGDATRPASILIRVTAGAVEAAFTNACGLDDGKGLGLEGMAERVAAMGGRFAAGRQGDQWVVRVSLAYTSSEAG